MKHTHISGLLQALSICIFLYPFLLFKLNVNYVIISLYWVCGLGIYMYANNTSKQPLRLLLQLLSLVVYIYPVINLSQDNSLGFGAMFLFLAFPVFWAAAAIIFFVGKYVGGFEKKVQLEVQDSQILLTSNSIHTISYFGLGLILCMPTILLLNGVYSINQLPDSLFIPVLIAVGFIVGAVLLLVSLLNGLGNLFR